MSAKIASMLYEYITFMISLWPLWAWLLSMVIVVKYVSYKRYQQGYWKGKADGWFGCEDMVIARAKKHGYDVELFLEDILQ